jgi:hypothetical protein
VLATSQPDPAKLHKIDWELAAYVAGGEGGVVHAVGGNASLWPIPP